VHVRVEAHGTPQANPITLTIENRSDRALQLSGAVFWAPDGAPWRGDPRPPDQQGEQQADHAEHEVSDVHQ
jgi:hypothetical protein